MVVKLTNKMESAPQMYCFERMSSSESPGTEASHGHRACLCRYHERAPHTMRSMHSRFHVRIAHDSCVLSRLPGTATARRWRATFPSPGCAREALRLRPLP